MTKLPYPELLLAFNTALIWAGRFNPHTQEEKKAWIDDMDKITKILNQTKGEAG